MLLDKSNAAQVDDFNNALKLYNETFDPNVIGNRNEFSKEAKPTLDRMHDIFDNLNIKIGKT